MMDIFDYRHAAETKELIFTGYKNNKSIDKHMVMLLMAIKKLTSTETRVLYDTYGINRPVCYRTYIFSVRGQLCHMLHTGLILPGDMMNKNQ